jgi:hypothetical protein
MTGRCRRTADVEDMAVVKQANPLSTITFETLAKKRRLRR